jgi:glycerate dehydrogenase
MFSSPPGYELPRHHHSSLNGKPITSKTQRVTFSSGASQPEIVVLDGFTLNPGDLSWDNLHALGTCQIFERTPPDQVLERAASAHIVITNKVPFTQDDILALPSLKYIGVTATGYNIIDVRAAQERDVIVTNVPAYGTHSVAQHTFALLLELTQHVGHHAQTVREGRWTQSADWCYWDDTLVELHGRTLGIIGFGRIGKAVAKLAQAFGMKVITCPSSTGKSPEKNLSVVTLEYLLAASDVVSLHCPLTPQTSQILNRERLAQMKSSAFLLNTSRGPLVEEQALADALNEGKLAGAGLDVLAIEPPVTENPLFTARNCVITPHIAWATHAARSRLLTVAVDNVRAFLNGTPANVVAPSPQPAAISRPKTAEKQDPGATQD